MSDVTKRDFALSLNEVNLDRLKDPDCSELERLAIGLVLARSGMSIAETANTVGVSVHKAWKKIAPHVSRDEKDAMIEELALDATVHLSLEVMQRLETPGGIKSSEVVKALQVMANIVGRKRKWDAPVKGEEDEKEESAMERLLKALGNGKLVVAETKGEES